MYLYQLNCSRCKRERKYKTGIAQDNFNAPRCLCGGVNTVTLLSDNCEHEIIEEYEEMEQDYFAM